MGKVINVRLDDRLIHGQIIASWINSIQCNRIVVADDKVANDKFQMSLLKMACPKSIALDIKTVEEAAKFLKETTDLSKVFLIFGNVDSATRLVDLGVDIDYINIGNIASNKKRKQYSKSLWLTDEEKEKFDKLKDRGINLIVQVVPSEKAVDYSSLVK